MSRFDTVPAPRLYDAGEFIVRRYQEGDGTALFEAVEASREHLWRMPWAREKGSVEASEAIVRRMVARYLQNEDYTLGVWKGEALVGGTGYHLRVGGPETLNAEIGMWIHVAHSGQGLGTKVLDALLRWGFDEWQWERLVWKCDTDNTASTRVAEKAGLTLEGTFKKDRVDRDGVRSDTLQFAILREEWEAANRRP